jgi:exopolysaccharide production protein ExoZ
MRLHNLDYLRGVAAAGIMIYHFLSWSFGEFGAESIFGRIGIYGVSVFYVLSGLTLYHVYQRSLEFDLEGLRKFYLKRVLRIYPLLWAVTIATIILKLKFPGGTKLFLNLTGLFGFVQWDAYIGTGVWSIGNELVFYAFFPFFVLFSKKYKPLFALSSVLIFAIYLYFAFVLIQPDQTISQQWANYVNPLNQVFLFWGGFVIGLVFETTSFKRIVSVSLIAMGVLLFLFYPAAAGDRVALVIGVPRLIFTAACFLICLGVYKTRFDFPPVLSKPLSTLGEASYSVYLIHPLVYSASGKIGRLITHDYGGWLQIVVSVFITLGLSYISFEKFEKYFMGLGKSKLKFNRLQ